MTTDTLDHDQIHRMYAAIGGTEASDADLVRTVSQRVQLPRAEPADSFILHAPLELLARAALLPWVPSSGRELARLRLVVLLAHFEEAAAAPIGPVPEPTDPAVAAAALRCALAAADLEGTDQAAWSLAVSAPAGAFAELLGADVLPALAAAGHAPIFLYQYPRTALRAQASAELLRPLARELARHPELRVGWVDDRPPGNGSAEALAEALHSVPQMGIPGSTFIFPLMHQVDSAGVAAELLGPTLGGLSPGAAARVLLRCSARAMVLANPDHIAYGWTHCLTMTQAALGIASSISNPQLALDIAGTYVVGFLAALATGPVPDVVELPDPGGTLVEAIGAGRAAAAGRVLHASGVEFGAMRTEIVKRAAGAHDAHVVKYTLACLDAAAADPAAERLYLSGAAALLAHWQATGDPTDPLAYDRALAER